MVPLDLQLINEVTNLLEAIDRRLAREDLPEIEFNGRELTWTTRLGGEPVLVPHPDMPGVATVAFSSATWLPGGPAAFEQCEGV